MTATSRPVRFPRSFIVIEGPNGTGKTTVAHALAERLRAYYGNLVKETREPSGTALGRAVRELETSMPPMALALACAADRFDHLAREIEPHLAQDAIVVCDRFLPSSLVLQRLDGLSLEEIWQLNAGVRSPDLTVYLHASPETLRDRLARRTRHSRFERSTSRETELKLYREARDFLAQRGWPQILISTDGRAANDVAAEIEGRLGD